MDPSIVTAIAENVGPTLGVLVCGAIPVSLYFLKKHFQLNVVSF
jgi:hypothetical protein